MQPVAGQHTPAIALEKPKKMAPSDSWLSRLFDFFRKIDDRYMARLEIIIIIALAGYIIGLTIFLIMLL